MPTKKDIQCALFLVTFFFGYGYMIYFVACGISKNMYILGI